MNLDNIQLIVGCSAIWGAHAPSRAGFGATAEMIFPLQEKFAMAVAPSPAREARALPRRRII